MYRTILIPIDGSDEANKGLKAGCALAEKFESKVILLCVTNTNISDQAVHAAVDEGLIRPVTYLDFAEAVQYPEITMSMAEENRDLAIERVANAVAERVVESGKSFTKKQHIPEVLTLIREGDAGDCIVSVAKSYDVDLTVIGTHPHKGFNDFFHTSVADHVRKHAQCSCLLLTPPHK